MEPSKQIKAVAQTYLQEQQLKEQAEYIAVLENTIITIAEQIGVEPQQLINELNVVGAIKSGFEQGGIKGAFRGGARAIGHNIRQAGQFGHNLNNPLDFLPTASSRVKGVARAASIKKVGAEFAGQPSIRKKGVDMGQRAESMIGKFATEHGLERAAQQGAVQGGRVVDRWNQLERGTAARYDTSE